jgi:hypothetical protein
MRKKKPVKVKPQSKREKPKEETVFGVLPFHEFFPLTLVHKDQNQEKVCYFVCQEHLDKYISRYKLNKKDYKISKTEPIKKDDNKEA